MWLLKLDIGILSTADVNDSVTEKGLPSVKGFEGGLRMNREEW